VGCVRNFCDTCIPRQYGSLFIYGESRPCGCVIRDTQIAILKLRIVKYPISQCVLGALVMIVMKLMFRLSQWASLVFDCVLGLYINI
jgi:hypothetical protein